MNIFFLDRCATQAASLQCDKHVVKMLLESTQLLYTAHHLCGDVGDWAADDLKVYKPTHANHPVARWVRASSCNYRWLLAHAKALANEYTRRYGRVHACEAHLDRLSTIPFKIPRVARAREAAHATLPLLATVNAPLGCLGAPVCIPEPARATCLTYVHGQIDLVSTYHNYYSWKQVVDGVSMNWRE